MRRRFIQVFMIGCATLGVALTVLWIVSFWRDDSIRIGPRHIFWIISSKGGLYLQYQRRFELSEEFWQGEEVKYTKIDDAFLKRTNRNFENSTTGELIGDSPFEVIGGPSGVRENFSASDAMTFRILFVNTYVPHYHGPGNWTKAYIIAAPHVAFAIPFLIPPAIALRRSVRKRSRAKAGACLTCGYDLRASIERCPECGTRFVA